MSNEVKCDHGVTFDEVEASKIPSAPDPKMDPVVAFILGPMSSSEIRKRWPRLMGKCPKGCGFDGIAYASFMHYSMGDW